MDEHVFDFDLNELPNDEEEIIQIEGNNTLELTEYPSEIGGSRKDDSIRNEFDPFIGQCFLSEEEAFIFFKKYDRTNKKNGEVKRRDFCCQCQGKMRLKLIDLSKEQRNTQSVKCGCKVRMRITLRKSFDIFPQEWQITEFIKDHNHELLSPSEVRFLPANRKITKDDEKRILLFKEAGLPVKAIMRVLELEKNISHGSLPFLDKDVRNLFTKIGKKNGVEDVKDLLQHCKVAQDENRKFQYAYRVDEERKLEHIFWSPFHSFFTGTHKNILRK
ncbi:hypothetical protein RHGRI_037427 [Rhododendron griersonianum]|uniref:Protein FAR1-RELATED SEQUENCE n=1 Tax=Rhododendron griersonianum TaxID=479676 RepID=A0AAV6HS46_9ERIC|nr:hypothetical protein RHGRI_037427 [Rhododendron griersonianum]